MTPFLSLEIQLIIAGDLLLAAVLSMLIGLDRERRGSAAGMRTHMLVGVGACLFTALSIYGFPGSDASRVAAQVVAGVGFLGAGTIIHRKHDVNQLTTAASIWVTAAVGMTVGAGLWFLGIISTLLIWTVLALFRVFKGHNDS